MVWPKFLYSNFSTALLADRLFSIALGDDLLLACNAVLLNKIQISMLNPWLDSCTCTYILELLDQGIIDLAVHRSQDTPLGDGSVQDLLNSNRAWDTNWVQLANVQPFVQVQMLKLTSLSHCGVTAWFSATVLAKS